VTLRPPRRPPNSQATQQVETPPCILCGKTSLVQVPLAGYQLWQQGAFIQTALPELTAAERELLKTGIHDECFNKITLPED